MTPQVATHVRRRAKIVGSSRAYINTEFLQFAEEVYDRGGLYAKLDECKQRGMTGTFGDTTLRSYVLAGQGVMLTFVRTTSNGGELLASFICNDGDPHGVSGGITALYAEPWDVVQMLREVRDNWAEQTQNYTGSESVSLILARPVHHTDSHALSVLNYSV